MKRTNLWKRSCSGKLCITENLVVWVHFCLWTVSSSVKHFPSLSPLQLCKATTMRSSLPTFALLGKLADAIPGFAEILVVKHSEWYVMSHWRVVFTALIHMRACTPLSPRRIHEGHTRSLSRSQSGIQASWDTGQNLHSRLVIMLLARQKQPLWTGVVGLPRRQHTFSFFFLDPVLGGLVGKLNCLWRELGWWIFIWWTVSSASCLLLYLCSEGQMVLSTSPDCGIH